MDSLGLIDINKNKSVKKLEKFIKNSKFTKIIKLMEN